MTDCVAGVFVGVDLCCWFGWCALQNSLRLHNKVVSAYFFNLFSLYLQIGNKRSVNCIRNKLFV